MQNTSKSLQITALQSHQPEVTPPGERARKHGWHERTPTLLATVPVLIPLDRLAV